VDLGRGLSWEQQPWRGGSSPPAGQWRPVADLAVAAEHSRRPRRRRSCVRFRQPV